MELTRHLLGNPPPPRFLRGSHVRVKGLRGSWVVVRDTGGKLVIVRRGTDTTSAPRVNVTTTKGKAT